jgi:hypothetical protein
MGKEEAPDLNDQGPDAIGVPSTGLSLDWVLASRANLRFTRRDDGIAKSPDTQEQRKSHWSGKPVKV